jgi:hypothetical protein
VYEERERGLDNQQAIVAAGASAGHAVVLNVISLGASYGFLTLFWQHGFGTKLVYGVPATGSIRDFIPILVFAFLFAPAGR